MIPIPAAPTHDASLTTHHNVEPLASFDVIDESPGFRRRGLTALAEHLWKLEPRP